MFKFYPFLLPSITIDNSITSNYNHQFFTPNYITYNSLIYITNFNSLTTNFNFQLKPAIISPLQMQADEESSTSSPKPQHSQPRFRVPEFKWSFLHQNLLSSVLSSLEADVLSWKWLLSVYYAILNYIWPIIISVNID